MSLLKEISITELSNLRIGHASDYNAQTGVFFIFQMEQKQAAI